MSSIIPHNSRMASLHTSPDRPIIFKLPVLVLAALFVLVVVSAVWGQEIEWPRQFGTSSRDLAWGITVDSTGVYVVGWTEGALPGQTNSGESDAFVRKYNADGNEVWTRQFGTSLREWAGRISVDTSGVYVAGDTGGALPGQTNSGESDVFVRKYDTDGNEVWTRQFGTPAIDDVGGISTDSTGVYVVGSTLGTLPGQTSSGFWDAFVRKYDADGNEVWTRQFGTSSGDWGDAISVDTSGVYVAGDTDGAFPGQTNSGEYDTFIRKYDADGNEVWTRQFGSSLLDVPWGIGVDSTGVYVAGETPGTLPGQTSSGEWDAYVRKYDKDGNEVWTRQFGTSSNDVGFGISVDASGVYVTVDTDGTLPGQTNSGEWDVFVRKYDTEGNEVWTRQFGTPANDAGNGISADASGVYVAGWTYGAFPGQTNSGGLDAYVIKIVGDPDGDGISDPIDGEFVEGQFVDQSTSFSDNFTDEHLGGTSFGSIIERGGLVVTVRKATNPAGLRLEATDGSGTATVGACNVTLLLTDDDSIVITCGSLTAQVLAGPIEMLLGADIAVTVPSETTAMVTELADGQFTIKNSPESMGTIIVEFQTKMIELDPGESGISVIIDIKPGSEPNCFNNDGHGVIPVAILSSADFDATQVDPSTILLDGQGVRVVGKGNIQAHIEDVDGDGLEDLVVQIEDVDGTYKQGNTTAILTGETFDSASILSMDSICIVP